MTPTWEMSLSGLSVISGAFYHLISVASPPVICQLGTLWGDEELGELNITSIITTLGLTNITVGYYQ